MSGKVWLQVALATVGGLIILVGIGICFAAIGGGDAVERMEASATERADPTATTTPEVVCPTPEEKAYFDKMKQMAELTGEAFQEYGELLQMGGENPAIAMDPEWQADVLRRLEQMRLNILAFKKVPVPESVEHIHADFMQAQNLIEEMVPLASAAIVEVNAYKMEKANRLVEDATPFMRSAADKKEAYCLQKFYESMAEESS